MIGWRDGLGPWTPVLEGDRLYGRGGADDGYATFAALLAIEVAKAHGLDHARLVVLIEASEESGSPDLPAHRRAPGRPSSDDPSLVICLDSGAADTRAAVGDDLAARPRRRDLTVEVLTEGVHSGDASGDRALELPDHPPAPRPRRGLRHRRRVARRGPRRHPCRSSAEAETTAAELGRPRREVPVRRSTEPTCDDPVEQILARTWRPTLELRRCRRVPADGPSRQRPAPVDGARHEHASPTRRAIRKEPSPPSSGRSPTTHRRERP